MQARRGGFEEMARLKSELGAVGLAIEDRLGRRRLDLREVADRVGAVDRRLRVRERGVRAPLAADAAGEIRFERILAPLDAEADGRLAVAIGVLVERKAQPRDRRLFRMLARNDRIEAPEPVEVGLQSAGACAIPPELATVARVLLRAKTPISWPSLWPSSLTPSETVASLPTYESGIEGSVTDGTPSWLPGHGGAASAAVAAANKDATRSRRMPQLPQAPRQRAVSYPPLNAVSSDFATSGRASSPTPTLAPAQVRFRDEAESVGLQSGIDRLAEIGRRLHRRDAGFLQRGELRRRRALAAGDDRAGMAHALARRRATRRR